MLYDLLDSTVSVTVNVIHLQNHFKCDIWCLSAVERSSAYVDRVQSSLYTAVQRLSTVADLQPVVIAKFLVVFCVTAMFIVWHD